MRALPGARAGLALPGPGLTLSGPSLALAAVLTAASRGEAAAVSEASYPEAVAEWLERELAAASPAAQLSQRL